MIQKFVLVYVSTREKDGIDIIFGIVVTFENFMNRGLVICITTNNRTHLYAYSVLKWMKGNTNMLKTIKYRYIDIHVYFVIPQIILIHSTLI